jgi:hypothetical protein
MTSLVCGSDGEAGNSFKILVGKRIGKQPHGRLRKRWEDNMKMDLRELGCHDGSGFGSCLTAGFGVSGYEPLGSFTRELVMYVGGMQLQSPMHSRSQL